MDQALGISTLEKLYMVRRLFGEGEEDGGGGGGTGIELSGGGWRVGTSKIDNMLLTFLNGLARH